MIRKLEELKSLTIKLLNDGDYEEGFEYDILDILEKLKKGDILNYLNIILNNYRYGESKDFIESSVIESFDFLIDDFKDKTKEIILDYKDISNYSINELNEVILDCFKFKNISLYSYECNGCVVSEYYKKAELLNILTYINDSKNEIIQIYEEDSILSIQLYYEKFPKFKKENQKK